MMPNKEREESIPSLEPTAASGLRRLAVPSALRASAAAQRVRWADHRAIGGRIK